MIKNISQQNIDNTIFQSQILKYILEFKWKNYAQREFLKKLLLFLIFWAIQNIIFIVFKDFFATKDHYYNPTFYIKIILYIISIYFAIIFLKDEK